MEGSPARMLLALCLGRQWEPRSPFIAQIVTEPQIPLLQIFEPQSTGSVVLGQHASLWFLCQAKPILKPKPHSMEIWRQVRAVEAQRSGMERTQVRESQS